MPRALWTVFVLLGCNPESPPNVPPTPSSTASSESSASQDAAPKKAGTLLWIDDKLVDCEGDHPMKCMRTRASADAEWELLYTPIEGFAFEEGNAYELRVDMTDPKKPRLVEIVSKKKVTANK